MVNTNINRGDYMALSEFETIRNQAQKEYDKRIQAGENCEFNDIFSRLLQANEVPTVEPLERETEEPINPIHDKQAYFWWKFKHDFFNDIAIQILSGKTNGDTLILLYIKLITLSLKCNGYICYEGVGGDLIEELTVHLHRSTDICIELIETLQKHNLITLSDDKETICIKNFADFTGADTPKTRMKNSRARNKQQKSVLN